MIRLLSSVFTKSSTSDSTSLVTFPQFTSLPLELRLKVWTFAIERRVHRIHLHKFHLPVEENDEENDEEMDGENGEENDEERGEEYGEEKEQSLEGGLPEEWDIYQDDFSPPHPCHMVITPCDASSHRCKCDYYPPKSPSALPLPAVLFVCRESRDVAISMYSICLNEEYDTRGLPVVKSASGITKSRASIPPETGIFFNPLTDALIVSANVASRLAVQEVHHFAATAAQQVPDIRKVIVDLYVGMPPYKFWSSTRFRYWENWGSDGWWVPMRFLIRMRELREVVFVKNKHLEELLPVEWKNRTEGQWAEEFLKVKEIWPIEWGGIMPSLRFIRGIEEV